MERERRREWGLLETVLLAAIAATFGLAALVDGAERKPKFTLSVSPRISTGAMFGVKTHIKVFIPREEGEGALAVAWPRGSFVRDVDEDSPTFERDVIVYETTTFIAVFQPATGKVKRLQETIEVIQ